MRGHIKHLLLQALLRAESALTESSLIQAAKLSFGERVMESDVLSCVRELESVGLASGNFNQILSVTTWTLTDLGMHKAKQLR